MYDEYEEDNQVTSRRGNAIIVNLNEEQFTSEK